MEERGSFPPLQQTIYTGMWASSADGRTLAATSAGQSIYVSTNSGATWSNTDNPASNWGPLAISADGREIVAAAYAGPNLISTDRGQTWTDAGAPHLSWTTLSVSADGNRIVAGTISDGIYTFEAAITLPSLNYQSIRKRIKISWVVPSSPAVLQGSPDGVNWENVTQKPLLNFSTLSYQVVLPATSDTFRLAPLRL